MASRNYRKIPVKTINSRVSAYKVTVLIEAFVITVDDDDCVDSIHNVGIYKDYLPIRIHRKNLAQSLGLPVDSHTY